MNNFSDLEFIERLKSRDHEAVTKVVEAYSDHLYKAALGMGFAKEEAKEVTHATWATFFEAIERFEGRSHIRTYLFGILYNKAKEQWRGDKKFSGPDPMDELFEQRFEESFDRSGHWQEPPRNPLKYAEDGEIAEIIERCLKALPALQRMAFTMKVILEENNEDICHKLGITNTNLRQLLFRGKGRLKTCIDGIYGNDEL